jgi:mannosylglycoprotein endo-beta-mannosidase
MSTGLRQFLRGWNQNLGRDTKAEKAALLTQIAELDVLADATGLDEDAWASRYHLEEQLLHIYIMEEEHWRHRGRVRWALQGDANTAYFHAVANGRRKCHISKLRTDNGTISEPKLIQEHVYEFYRNLLGSSAPRVCGLAPSSWVRKPAFQRRRMGAWLAPSLNLSLRP